MNTPRSLYFLSGSISALVFFYTIQTIFIMSATGSVSFLLMKLTSMNGNNGLMPLMSIGLLLLVISCIFLGSYLVQLVFLLKHKDSLKYIFYLFVVSILITFTIAYLFNHEIQFANILKIEGRKPYNNIYLSFLLSATSFIIGMVWMLIDGTTAMSNAVKEIILSSSGATKKNYKSFLGLIGFIITGIAYYAAYEFQPKGENKINETSLILLLVVNMLIILILIYDAFCVNDNGKKLLSNMAKNCHTIPKSNFKPIFIRNIGTFLLMFSTGILITTPLVDSPTKQINELSKKSTEVLLICIHPKDCVKTQPKPTIW